MASPLTSWQLTAGAWWARRVPDKRLKLAAPVICGRMALAMKA